jgi:hypothetical protein
MVHLEEAGAASWLGPSDVKLIGARRPHLQFLRSVPAENGRKGSQGQRLWRL